MLQQNNNNNYPCLERSVLQHGRKSGVPFAIPIEFGDMSLIKTLRAWARSGMPSAKPKGGATTTAPLHHQPHLAKSPQCPPGNVSSSAPGIGMGMGNGTGTGTGTGVPLTTRSTAQTGPGRTAVVGGSGQTGLGALVTVATLKASEGGRQTQTRCLLLKAEGRNYVCAVTGPGGVGGGGGGGGGGNSNRCPAGTTAPSRATLVGSWLRETMVGSKDSSFSSSSSSGATRVGQGGPCDGEVFRVKPRPAKKWRKLSSSSSGGSGTHAGNADSAPGSSGSGRQVRDANGLQKLEEGQEQNQHPHHHQQQQQQQQHQDQVQGARGEECVSARLNSGAHGKKHGSRGTGQRAGNGRTKERSRGGGSTNARRTRVSKKDRLHVERSDGVALAVAKENVDITNVPCHENCSCPAESDISKTWNDCTTEASRNINEIESSLQSSHFTEAGNSKNDDDNTPTHTNNLEVINKDTTGSVDRTGDIDVRCTNEQNTNAEDTKDATSRDTDPAVVDGGLTSNTWVSTLSPDRHHCTELGLEKQHCCCKDTDPSFTLGSKEPLPEPVVQQAYIERASAAEAEEERVDKEALDRQPPPSLTDLPPPAGHGRCCAVGGDYCDGSGGVGGRAVEGQDEVESTKSNILSAAAEAVAAPETEEEEEEVEVVSAFAPERLPVTVEDKSEWNADGGVQASAAAAAAAAAKDYGNEGQGCGSGSGNGSEKAPSTLTLAEEIEEVEEEGREERERGEEGGGRGGIGEEQRDLWIRSTDNNPRTPPALSSLKESSSSTPTTVTPPPSPKAPTVSSSTQCSSATLTLTLTLPPSTTTYSTPCTSTNAPAAATAVAHACPNPTAPDSMATGLPGPRRERAEARGGARTLETRVAETEGEAEEEDQEQAWAGAEAGAEVKDSKDWSGLHSEVDGEKKDHFEAKEAECWSTGEEGGEDWAVVEAGVTATEATDWFSGGEGENQAKVEGRAEGKQAQGWSGAEEEWAEAGATSKEANCWTAEQEGEVEEEAESKEAKATATEADIEALSVGQKQPPPPPPGHHLEAENHTADTVASNGQIVEGGGRGGGAGGGRERHEGDEEKEDEEEDEDEFGGFMQAGEDGFSEFHQVPCGIAEVSDKSDAASWQSDWMASSAHQSDESWAAFDQEVGVDQACGAELASGQWWPCSATKDTVDHSNTPGVFLAAFPPVVSVTFNLDGIPTLKQLLRGAAEQKSTPEDHGERTLLDGFQDLNKMLGLKHKRTESPSWKHLLSSLQVAQHHSAHRSDLPQGHGLSAGHPLVNLHAPLANKRRLSYDLNRNHLLA
ncbi:uncharacterized protein si:ch211-14c7.2 [Engraulis encrasicolus]|uniref:uncharacterized protein si:ch211-14c7.2 n=1 Tax=Engraulis encrasicolus TaxID=184585 RepID=UPI002FCF4BDB